MTPFVERTIRSLNDGLSFATLADDSARAGGWLQSVDPRVKVIGIFALICASAATHSLSAIAAVFLIACVLAIGSRISLADLARWAWTPALLFTGCIALPAIFATPGARINASLPVTMQGLRTASLLLLRAETAISLSALLVLTTRWAHILKALRVLRLPVVFVVILGMTYRYLFLILEIALDMFESRKSRTVGVLEPADRRRLAAATAGVLLSKSYHLSADVHLAMQSRGFRGEVYMLDDFEIRSADWVWLVSFLAIATAVVWVGR